MYIYLYMYTCLRAYIHISYIIYIFIYIHTYSGQYPLRTIHALSELLNETYVSTKPSIDLLNEDLLFEVLTKSIEKMDSTLWAPWMYEEGMRMLIQIVLKGMLYVCVCMYTYTYTFSSLIGHMM
jgi:hypothetical protein